MRELSVPATIRMSPSTTLTDMVYDNSRRHPRSVCVSRQVDGVWTDVTAGRFAAEVTAVAGGLVASGVRAGDRVALMSRTRYEWTLLDYAIWAAGAVTVPVYETSSVDQVRWILTDSEAVAAVVETDAHRRTVDAARADLPALREVWQIERGAVHTLVGLGAGRHESTVADRRAALDADTLATIIYTSGTTGRPKGCALTHRNLLATVHSLLPDQRAVFNENASTLLFLPLAHVFARTMQCAALCTRTRLGYVTDRATLAADLKTFRPTVLFAVPHVLTKVYNTARQAAHDSGRGRLFDRAERAAIDYSEALDGGAVRPLLRLRHRIFDTLVYARLRAELGGRCRRVVSGGAPLGSRLAHFFRGAGVSVFEGYGLTETTGGVCANTEDAQRIGSVGRPVPGASVRVDDDGEVWIAGDAVFAGYWHNPGATAASLVDGWFRTGDLGDLDPDGFLTVVGRVSEMIVTDSGKNVSPGTLEDRLRVHPLISQAVVVGEGRPFIACLVALDGDFLPGWLAAHGRPADTPIAELRADEVLRAEIQAAVDDANQAVSRAEAIRRFRILDRDLSVAGGELTPSLKPRRAVILDRFAADVAALYDTGGP